jgi:Leucine-rich repeat (LRR) protein
MISDAGIEELQAALKTTKIQTRPLDPQRLVARWVLEQGGAVVVAENADTTAKVDKPSDLPRVACKVREVSLRNSARLQPDQLAAKLRECQELRSLDLSGNAGLVDRHVASLGTLKTLESLYLAKTGVTDSAFEKLGALPELKVLGLQGTLVSGSGLVKHPLPKLTHLYAGTTDFSDATLKGLKESTDLLVLDLSNCKLVTDRGMPELAAFSKLEQLDLSLTRVTDQSGAVLAKLTQLKKLNLYGLPVTDALVSQLSGLTQLEEINLAKTKVGDGALAPLSGIKTLRRISVWGTSVTDAAAQPLRDRGVEVNKSADPAQRDANGGTGF